MDTDKPKLPVHFSTTDEHHMILLHGFIKKSEKTPPKDLKTATNCLAQYEHNMTKNKHLGSSFDDFLEEEGILDEVESAAVKNILAYQLQQELANRHITKTDLANRMNTSRAAVNRLLDPDNQSVTLLTLQNAARALGKKLHVEII